MTMAEAIREAEGFVWRNEEADKREARFSYTTAMTVGAFVASIFGNSKPPEIYDIFPEYFDRKDEAEHNARTQRSIENFIKFANAHNQKCED